MAGWQVRVSHFGGLIPSMQRIEQRAFGTFRLCIINAHFGFERVCGCSSDTNYFIKPRQLYCNYGQFALPVKRLFSGVKLRVD